MLTGLQLADNWSAYHELKRKSRRVFEKAKTAHDLKLLDKKEFQTQRSSIPWLKIKELTRTAEYHFLGRIEKIYRNQTTNP